MLPFSKLGFISLTFWLSLSYNLKNVFNIPDSSNYERNLFDCDDLFFTVTIIFHRKQKQVFIHCRNYITEDPETYNPGLIF